MTSTQYPDPSAIGKAPDTRQSRQNRKHSGSLSLTPWRIAKRVSMPRLLRTLRLPVNDLTRFSSCPLCGSKRKDAFRWDTAGRWRCSECGKHGDKFDLVRTVKRCGFRDALIFLCRLARVPVPPAPRHAKHRPSLL